MAKITRDEVRDYFKVSAGNIKYDAVFDTNIDFAYGYIDEWISIDTANDKYREYLEILDLMDEVSCETIRYIYVSGLKKDIVLTKVELEGIAINLTTDLKKVDFGRWEIINDTYIDDEYQKFYVEYTSVNLTAGLKKILIEIIIYEVNKLPEFNNSISKKSSVLSGSTMGTFSEQYVTDETFYKEIEKKLRGLFYRKV